MLTSKISPVGLIKLPTREAQLYMHPVDLSNPTIPDDVYDFQTVIDQMLRHIQIRAGTAYVTIDSRTVNKGSTHRRGGPHVDGNYLFYWGQGGGGGGGGGWLTGDNGRYLPLEKHLAQYTGNAGGMLIASSYPACRAWEGQFDTVPLQGGNCAHIIEHLTEDRATDLKENTIYLANATCIHESLPLDVTTHRTLVRITLPHTETYI